MDIGWHVARDGVHLRLARWRAPRAAGAERPQRGTALLLNGRAEFVEKYAETAADLVARGFDVLSMDWRGQGLSDRLTDHPERGHLDSVDDLIADLDEVVEAETGGRQTAAGPVIVLAHSMGGHVALRWLAEHPGKAALAVLVAPMVLVALPGAARAPAATAAPISALARRAVRQGWDRRYALGQRDYRPGRWGFRNNLLTGDPQRFDVHRRHFDESPALRLGGVTWGWLDAAYRSSRILTQPAYLRRIRVPVLICQAGREVLVSNPAQRQLAALLPHGRLTVYRDSFHEILMERDEIRSAFWADFDTFLADHGI